MGSLRPLVHKDYHLYVMNECLDENFFLAHHFFLNSHRTIHFIASGAHECSRKVNIEKCAQNKPTDGLPDNQDEDISTHTMRRVKPNSRLDLNAKDLVTPPVSPDCNIMTTTTILIMKGHSSQTRIVGKVDGQFLHALWWL